MSDEKDQVAAIWEIVDRHYGPQRGALKSAGSPPFDISKDNIHDSKADFVAEFNSIKLASDQSKALLDFLFASFRSEDFDLMSRRVTAYIDQESKEAPFEHSLMSVHHLVLMNAIETGISFNLFHILRKFDIGLRKRKQELENQEAVFWTAKNRPPNHFARSIALRFAQWVAERTGKRPTFGTSRDGGHPSTVFGRALEEIFNVLEIKSSPKLPAKWAIEALTDEFISNAHQQSLDEIILAKSRLLEQAGILDKIAKMKKKVE